MGLGLYIVQEIVQEHDGCIAIASQAGAGNPRGGALALRRKTAMNPRLLVVDDEPVAVKNLAYALRKNGYDVTTRESGTGGLEALQHQIFDVILTDLRMERVDGMAILKRALETDPDIAVVLITAHGTLDSAVEAMKAGAFHYIAKPFRLDEVRSIVANALQLVQLKRENRALRAQVNSGLHTQCRVGDAKSGDVAVAGNGATGGSDRYHGADQRCKAARARNCWHVTSTCTASAATAHSSALIAAHCRKICSPTNCLGMKKARIPARLMPAPA